MRAPRRIASLSRHHHKHKEKARAPHQNIAVKKGRGKSDIRKRLEKKRRLAKICVSPLKKERHGACYGIEGRGYHEGGRRRDIIIKQFIIRKNTHKTQHHKAEKGTALLRRGSIKSMGALMREREEGKYSSDMKYV